MPLSLLDTVLQNDYAFRFVKPDQFTRDFKCSFSPSYPLTAVTPSFPHLGI